MEELKRDKRVKGVTSQLSAKIFYAAGAIDLNGIATGIDIEEESRLYNISNYIPNGDYTGLIKEKNTIILGAGIAKKLSLRIGDKIQLKNPQGGIFPMKIVAFYQSGLAEVDNMQSYVSRGTAQRLMGVGNNYITNINVKLNDVNQAPAFAKEMTRRFDVNAVDINTANAQFDTGTSIRNLITYSVSVTLLVVAGFGIYNILNMFIYEKMDDIAILKATGFSAGDVSKIFISQAILIGFFGGLLGLIFGFIVSWLISNTPFNTEALPTVDTYPINFNPGYYIFGMIFAMVSTFLAGYLPSRKAKKIDPVEIIRGK
jgi:lipoprotein-releasing system permease protein